ncbi:Wzz/FepE/Etk N-terminal domain-containing protein, partial [Fangia hongkongensis]|uniref:Wzz/FepE/Etk N-terminal domain-containing protein n=3 Tax=Fangia hongkongensis TaxID=270495 RepID=UPI001907A152
MESTQNDVISISDLLIVLIKRIKLWLTIFILGSLFSIIYGALHKDNYAYSALIKGPSYLSNGQM